MTISIAQYIHCTLQHIDSIAQWENRKFHTHTYRYTRDIHYTGNITASWWLIIHFKYMTHWLLVSLLTVTLSLILKKKQLNWHLMLALDMTHWYHIVFSLSFTEQQWLEEKEKKGCGWSGPNGESCYNASESTRPRYLLALSSATVSERLLAQPRTNIHEGDYSHYIVPIGNYCCGMYFPLLGCSKSL